MPAPSARPVRPVHPSARDGASAVARSAAPTPRATEGGPGKRKLVERLRDIEWGSVIEYLVQAGEDGVSREEAIEAAAIILDEVTDWEERIDGRLGRQLERIDRMVYRRMLGLAWDLIERRKRD